MSDSLAAGWRAEIRADLAARLTSARHSAQSVTDAPGVRVAAPKVIPSADGRPPLVLPENAGLPDLTLPPFLKAGLMVVYSAGDMHNVGHGYIGGASGTGYTMANVNFAIDGLVTIDVRNFLIEDPTRPRALSVGSTAAVGDAVSAGIYWIHPKLVAALAAKGAPPQAEGVTIEPVPWKSDRTILRALKVNRVAGKVADQAIYDLETGLLLYRSHADAGGELQLLSQATYLDRRTLRIPWALQPPPDWVATTRTLRFEGSNTISLGTGVIRQATRLLLELAPLHPHVLLAKVTSHVEQGPGFPSQLTTWDMACAPAMAYPLWIAPASLRQMQRNQVVDEDPFTHFRITFGGIENGRASVIEQGPLEHNTYFFDMQRGILLGMRAQRPYADGAGRFVMETWLREQQ